MSDHPESRILVISASLDQARAAVKLIKAFVDDDDPSDLPLPDTIPWTIKNKYYSADVHFRLVEFAHWNPQSALRVPAVIFVWACGQPYAEHVFALQNGLSRFEPEVALAVALGREPPHHDDPPEGPDSFLADHGFEYIDGERTRHPERTSTSAETTGDEIDDDDEDVQGLPRVIDALSTIMWPTMVRKRDEDNASSSRGGGKRQSQLRPSLFDFDDVLHAEGEEADEETTLAALMEADAADHGVPLTRASRMQREMDTLERWLVENEELHEAELRATGLDDNDVDEDEDDHSDSGDALPSVQVQVQDKAPDIRVPPSEDDPWTWAPNTSKPTSTPTPTPSMTTAAVTAASHTITIPSSGFDDDFSAFVPAPVVSVSVSGAVSAPASTSAFASVAAVAHLHDNHQTLALLPSHTGGSFRSLRSAASDVEIGDDVGYEALDDRSSLNFSADEYGHGHGPENEHPRVLDDDPDLRTSMDRVGERTASLGDVPFDLANILGTLQTMREDVARIEDEGERRATTARFASEFVFNRMGVDGDEREETTQG
ncbi:hypothetical protein BJV74DRAFT_385226 [Russula compacta]|nr:hypothetical protein BJV74DRAFT_385226 [Russula compacta]